MILVSLKEEGFAVPTVGRWSAAKDVMLSLINRRQRRMI